MGKSAENEIENAIDDTFPHAEEAIENAKAKVKNLWSDAQSNGRKTWGRTKGFIQKHPAKAVGLAVLLGVVVGILLSPNSRD